MKKTLILICCVIIASMGIVLTGCGSSGESSGDKFADSPYEGIWELKGAELDGKKVDDADALLGSMSIMFDTDGTAIFMGNGVRIDDLWEPTEDGLKLWKEGEEADAVNFVYKDGKLVLELELDVGHTAAYFEKEED
ncbi:MAG: hypothetical protein Q4C14_08395 [Bacillota bacterium]|nr:hypothetical protein [Bacillota bacterium]